MKRFTILSILAVLCVAAVMTLGALAPARAQDSGAGKIEVLTSLSTSISTSAAITSATTGKRQVIRSAVLASSGAGVVVLRDGDGGDLLAAIYLEANKPFAFTPELLGGGIRSSSGNAIYATLSGATLTAVMRVQRE